ncbi:NAD(P)-dependent oxidoreductase [Pseudonocardia sp. TRM90224]|uniref:NAD(P)-dependent oxidoreductase n=1 Tax=Pseudonocardia sp. TRM90224 TaxID=2812678 RepID=UPI001E3B4B76|nr:NAD(P)H-binding protein [Pseudonocardia sp. TRM90224]
MSSIIVFGAGGRAGRRAVAEAVARGHDVTAVVRAGHEDLAANGVRRVTADVTDAAAVAKAAAGHDAAITAATRLDVPAVDFYTAATTALVDGLTAAGVRRLVLVGIGSVLEVEPGLAFHDAPGYPAEYRPFSIGHVAQLDVLAGAPAELDWLVLAPPPTMLDAEAPRTGRYRTGGTAVLPTQPDRSTLFSYADLAVALLDEIETPRHHRALVAVDH